MSYPMFAKVRLFFTASRDALVAEGDVRAAFLYAAPGDEIPESVVTRFGLVDGALPSEIAQALDTEAFDAILRAAVVGSFGALEIAGLTFTHDFRTFAKGDIDIAQLLEMVTSSHLLTVEALQFVGDEAKQWGPIPGGLEFIRQLELLVSAAQSIGAPMPRLGEEPSMDIVDAVNAAEEARRLAAAANADAPANAPLPADNGTPMRSTVTGDVAPVPPAATEEAPMKEAATPVESKEKAPAENKEARRAASKGSKSVEAKD